MNIIIITQGISPIVMPLLKSKHNILGIIESAPRKNSNQNIYRKLPWRKTLKKLATRHKIPYYYMSNGSDQSLQDWVQKIMPDIIVVSSMSQLLKENIFSIPKYGTINLHKAYLPEYRGPNPAFWMYYNMELNPGVTIHYIDKGEDTGDILFQERYTIPLGIKLFAMQDIAFKIGIKLIFCALDAIENNTIVRIQQPQSSPTVRARNLRPEEHGTIIDWNSWSVERIWHVLRGSETYLNAIEQPSGLYCGQRWEIDSYKKYVDYEYGKIYKKEKLSFIACRDGIIILKLHFNVKLFIKNILRLQR